MKTIILAVVLAAAALVPSAEAGRGSHYGSVAVASHTYTAMVSTSNYESAYAMNICNDSTDTIRCGYDVSVSTVAGNANLGFAVRTLACVWRAVSNIIYCKSEANNITSACTVEVFK